MRGGGVLEMRGRGARNKGGEVLEMRG